MRRVQICLSALALALCCSVTNTSAQEQRRERALDQQLEKAHVAGLFKEKVSPFEVQENKTQAFAKSAFATVKNATLLKLSSEKIATLHASHPQAVTLEIPQTNNEPLELELIQQSPLDNNFNVVTSESNGQPVAYSGGYHYRGIVKGQPASTVAISVFGDEMVGAIGTENAGNLIIGKLETEGNVDNYILYSEKDIADKRGNFCSAEEPVGYAEKMRQYLDDAVAQKTTVDKCVKVYIEVDYALYQNKGGVTQATNYITAVFNNLAILYANEQITTKISQVYVWTTMDNYSRTSANTALGQFKSARPTFNGDIAHLAALGNQNLGGVAWLDVICTKSYAYAYSNIRTTYNTVPTYSWSVEVMTHEMGHNLGSPHTQSCSWTGGALDNCYAVEGTCAPGPQPTNGGTIMSYCHLTSTGINFNNGFGTQPGNLIRNRVTNASCLSVCSTDTSGPNPPTCDSAILTIKMDNYPGEVSWNIKNSSNVVVASGSNYSGAGSTKTIRMCLPRACYTLTMFDSYGDGICCSYGQGFYNLKNATGTVLASGGQYGSQDVKNFCLGSGSSPMPPATGNMEVINSGNLKIYPNPTNNVFNLEWMSKESNTATITLTDMVGKVIVKQTMNSNEGTNKVAVPVSNIATGIYMINVNVNGTVYQQKVTVQK